jgi:peptide chain release factor subunit 1
MEVEDLDGILVGGPGSTKDFFVEKGYLHHELTPKVVDLFDTGYTDEYGLKELVDKAADTLSDVALMVEKKLVQRFMAEIVRSGSKSAYGIDDVVNALNLGAVDTLLISEGLRVDRHKLSCTSCGTMTAQPGPIAVCPSCSTAGVSEVVDLVRELVDLAEQSSSEVEFISPDSDEGAAFLNTFGGVAAILRYQLDQDA